MSSKYDLFGGKILSSNTRKFLNQVNVKDLIDNMRSPPKSLSQWKSHGDILFGLYSGAVGKAKKSVNVGYNRGSTENKVKSYLNGVFTGAWKRVVNHFFVIKQVKESNDDGFGSHTKTKVFLYTDRKGKTHTLNSIEYFKKKHPRLYKRYLETFHVLKQGGVVSESDGQLGFVQRSKFEKYSSDEKTAILAFLSYAHYGGKTGNVSTGLTTNRGDNQRYGDSRQRILGALATVRKLAKAGKLTQTDKSNISSNFGVNVVVNHEPAIQGTVNSFARSLNDVNVQDLYSASGTKISFRGRSNSERKELEKAIKNKKNTLISILKDNTDLTNAIEKVRKRLKEETASKKEGRKYSNLQKAYEKVVKHINASALNQSSLKGLADNVIFKNPDQLDHRTKTLLKKYANALKLVSKTNGTYNDAIQQLGGKLRQPASGGGSRRHYSSFDEFTNSMTSDTFMSGGGSMSSYSLTEDDFVFGGGGCGSKKHSKKDSYIWFV